MKKLNVVNKLEKENVVWFFSNNEADTENNIVKPLARLCKEKFSSKYQDRQTKDWLIYLEYPNASADFDRKLFFESPQQAAFFYKEFKGVFIIDGCNYGTNDINTKAIDELIKYVIENQAYDFKFILVFDESIKDELLAKFNNSNKNDERKKIGF